MQIQAVYLSRAPIRLDGIRVLDITVKSAVGQAAKFAPTWEMVMGHKRRTISDDEYTVKYHRLLDALPEDAWNWLHGESLRQGGFLLLGCYCPEGTFCHTHVLIEYACNRFADRFRDGRITPESDTQLDLHFEEDED